MTQTSELKISAAVREVWETKYAAAIGAAPSYDEELARIRELRTRVQEGLTWNETGEEARIGPAAWTPQAVQAEAGDGQTDAAGNRRKLMIFTAIVLGVAAVLILLVMLPTISRNFRKTAKAGGTATITSTVSLPAPTVIAPVVIGDDNLKLPLAAPRSLEMQDRAWLVVPGKVSAGGQMQLPDPVEKLSGMVVWFSSPVNWLFGLPDQAALEALRPGDHITARTQTGQRLAFVVDSTQMVSPQSIEWLAQQSPGLTLMALTDEPQVRLVRARYDAAEEAVAIAAVDAGLGAPVEANGGQFAVAGVTVERRAGAYAVLIAGVASVDLPDAVLEMGGQIYPPAQPLRAGTWSGVFVVPALDTAQFVAGGKRVDLGLLAPPVLSAQITNVTVNASGLEVTLQVDVAGGVAEIRAGDLALRGDGVSGETAPLEMQPAAARVEPGQPLTLVTRWHAPSNRTPQVRLFDQIWEISLP